MTTSQQLSRSLEEASTPPIFVLPSHLQFDELNQTEDTIEKLGGTLTYDPKEARLFLGLSTRKKRAAFDLRARGVWTKEATLTEPLANEGTDGAHDHLVVLDDSDEGAREPARKKTKVEPSDHGLVGSEKRRKGNFKPTSPSSNKHASPSPPPFWPDLDHRILVLELAWLDACLQSGHLVPYRPYIVYTAEVMANPNDPTTGAPENPNANQAPPPRQPPVPTTTILERAKAEAAALPPQSTSHHSRAGYGDHTHHARTSPKARPPPRLHNMTTSESEERETNPLPPLPDWATGPDAAYSCCRSTPMNPPNASFIAQLVKIREARTLKLDDIGVRAYSTAIATLSAYPHHVRRADEITRLPGCEAKIAQLWSEWFVSADLDADRHIQTVRDLDADADLQVLRLFYHIWGVGAETARKFYFEHGWRDLDDVVEFGWARLTRVQQIGVKFYDEFRRGIPRPEVEAIGDVIRRHARSVLNIDAHQYGTAADAECVIVGGYRRGKAESGDVDVVLSHRELSKTKDFVLDIVRSLEEEGWITHTLSLHTTTSDRDQATLPYKAGGRRGGGHSGPGFDSLDKALCVWQDPHFVAEDGATKNPNVHRRVDIIISPWRTVGCAVLGWSGGTTFQRDIRRFVDKRRDLKFDSSGVRNRSSGLVLDFEGPRPRGTEAVERILGKEAGRDDDDNTDPADMDDGDTWQDRERRLMEGLGIGYRPPEERCTG
jgi:DNA polymerase IV